MARRRAVWISIGAGVVALLSADGVRSDAPVTGAARFNGPIVRIFQKKCVGCHAPGNLAMSLASYHDARPWARAIREEILERRMPPWPAASGIRPLANDISLTVRERALIVSWTDGGTPRGEDSELPPPRPASDGWPRGEPDLEIPLPPQTVEADEPHRVHRLTVAPELTGGGWITGLDFRPGDRRVVRSVFVDHLARGGAVRRWLGAWTPWHATAALPPGVAHRVSDGSRLALEIHYQGTDARVTDRSTLGLYLTKQPPEHEPIDLVVDASCRASAPHVACDGARGDAVAPFDAVVWAVKPESGAASRSIEVSARRPDAGVDVLVWMHRPQDGWQTPFVFREPVSLPRGARVTVVAHYDGAAPRPDRRTTVTLSLYPQKPPATAP